jgi:hypothetical protein
LLAWEQFSEFSERVCFHKMPRKEQRYTTSRNITRTGGDKRERYWFRVLIGRQDRQRKTGMC